MVIFCIFTLISLVLHGNLATLRQLSLAADRFKRGDRQVRVRVRGAAEINGAANAFNDMAEEVEQLLQSNHENQKALQEQLHFMQQLLAVLPIPIFVKGMDERYLSFNKAWEKLFDIPGQSLLNKRLVDLYPDAPDIAKTHREKDLALMKQPGKQIYEISIPVGGGEWRDAVYYKATFTNIDGSLAGIIGAIVDITERKRAELLLLAEKERAEITFSSIGDAVISTDTKGRVEAINPAAEKLTGWKAAEAKGRLLEMVFPIVNEATKTPAVNLVQQVIVEGNVVSARNILVRAKNGEEIAIENSAAPIRDHDGNILGCVLVFHDVREKRQLLEQITWQAGHDTLTSLPNRILLADRMVRALANAHRQNRLLAVCLLDLDGFKPVNDRHGHEQGDRLLIEVAGRLEKAVRGGDTVARLGGDEFVLLISDLNDMDAMEVALQRVLTAVSEPYLISEEPLRISASIGVAVYPLDDADSDTLLRHADQAMYQAKQGGRNRFQLFDADQDLQQQTRNQEMDKIRQALIRNELRLFYQPKVNMRNGRVVGMEALLRWQHTDRGLIGPMAFLPLAEQSDMIVQIGEWVLHEALRQMQEWLRQGEVWPVSVNIAARHFQRPDFVSLIEKALSLYPEVPPQYLELEILESAALGDIQHVYSVITECQKMGVNFALDDFGTGYSSLTYLKRLPANIIKIDQSFVRDMLDDQEDLALVEAVISLSKVFNRAVIAEGVETVEHGVLLLRLGCDEAQGYGIARPMPPAEVPNWVEHYKPDPSWAQWADISWELSDFPLIVAQFEHIKWIDQVVLSVEDLPLLLMEGEIADPHVCRFGQWYDRQGKERYGHLAEFSELEALHTKVHEIGSEIVRLNHTSESNKSRDLAKDLLLLKVQIVKKLETIQMTVTKML